MPFSSGSWQARSPWMMSGTLSVKSHFREGVFFFVRKGWEAVLWIRTWGTLQNSKPCMIHGSICTAFSCNTIRNLSEKYHRSTCRRTQLWQRSWVELLASPQAIEKDLGFVVRAMITPLLCWGLGKKSVSLSWKDFILFFYTFYCNEAAVLAPPFLHLFLRWLQIYRVLGQSHV